MNNREFEIIFGIICMIISILLGLREIKIWNNLEKEDYILKSFSVKKIGAIIGLFLVGIAGIYRYFS
tara:strand:+ start:180 stop:380 length:201 start_codon:yes stop_codon:yes gene_type:complete